MGLFDKRPKKNSTTEKVVEEHPATSPVYEESTANDRVFEGTPLPDWSNAQLTLQKPRIADRPPDLVPLIMQAIERAGQGSPRMALERLYNLIGVQIDAFALQFPELSDHDFKAIRKELFARPDFNGSMLFSSLTYFGITGVAMNNELIEQIPLFIEALEDAARQGHMEEEDVGAEPTSD